MSATTPRALPRRRAPLLAVLIAGVLALGGSTPGGAQDNIFQDGFESGTCLGWHLAVPFCITPTVGLRVEITWDTPGDPDPDDEVGSDLDLHVLHPLAAGDWESELDCYSGNPTPDWGLGGQFNDAALIFEDDDGLGPEAVQITAPESFDYAMGAYYVDDSGFGESFVTLTVYDGGVPVYQYPGKLLFPGEFWEVGLVTWPGAGVTEIDVVYVGIP